MNPLKEPRLPIFIVSPTNLEEVGSPTIQSVITSSFFDTHFNSSFVPYSALPSSSLVIKSTSEQLSSSSVITSFRATRNAATEDFISTEPLPKILPSLISPLNGLLVHKFSSPGGTTST